jgi:hypothetical protein
MLYRHDCAPRSRITSREGLLAHLHLRACLQFSCRTSRVHQESI